MTGVPETEGDRRLLAKYLRWEANQFGSCPVCGAEVELLTPEQRGWKAVAITPEGYKPGKRYGVLHSGFEHRRARIAPVGYYE